MLSFRSILCPVDFSEASQQALQAAAALAARFQSQVTVLSAVEPLLAYAAEVHHQRNLATTETEPALREFVTATLPDASLAAKISIVVRVGEPSQMILETADREGADLIVMGTHGLGGVRKLLLGSTTERVLRQTPVPLLAVPSASQAPALKGSELRFMTGAILAATDFSPASTEAIHRAADLAQMFDVPLTIVHVVPPLAVPTRWQTYVDLADETRVQQARERLETWLKEAVSTITPDVVVVRGRPADTIASIAADTHADLIVLGLFSDRGSFAPRPGSIAYRVLATTRIPVLVIVPR